MRERVRGIVCVAICCAVCLLLSGPVDARVRRFTTDPGAELIWRLPLEEKLERSISFSFDGVPLSDVVDFLRELLKVNIVLDEQVLLEDERLITFRADSMRAANALRWIVTLARLDYGLRNGAIYVSTSAGVRAASTRRFEVYDVRDLVGGGARNGSSDETGDDDDGGDEGGRSSAWLVKVIVQLTGRENWRHVSVIGGGEDRDETTNGADDF